MPRGKGGRGTGGHEYAASRRKIFISLGFFGGKILRHREGTVDLEGGQSRP